MKIKKVKQIREAYHDEETNAKPSLASTFLSTIRQVASGIPSKKQTASTTNAVPIIYTYIKFVVKTGDMNKVTLWKGREVKKPIFLHKGVIAWKPMFFDTRASAAAGARARRFTEMEIEIMPIYIATTINLMKIKDKENTTPLTFEEFAKLQKNIQSKYSKVFWNIDKLTQWCSRNGYKLQFDNDGKKQEAINAEKDSERFSERETKIIRRIWQDSEHKPTFHMEKAINQNDIAYVKYPAKITDDDEALEYLSKAFRSKDKKDKVLIDSPIKAKRYINSAMEYGTPLRAINDQGRYASLSDIGFLKFAK